jgi:hypothetical protein
LFASKAIIINLSDILFTLNFKFIADIAVSALFVWS